MKLLFVAIMFYMGCSCVSAQSMRDIWINMPKGLIPYLDKSLRTDLIDGVKKKPYVPVKNLLGDTTRIERMTDNYLKVRLNNKTYLQIKKINANTIAVVKSWNYPTSDSELNIYSTDWRVQKYSKIDLTLHTEKPDTMQESTYNELKSLLSPYFVVFTLLEKKNDLIVDYSFPLLGKKEYERVKPIIKTKVLHWQDNGFK